MSHTTGPVRGADELAQILALQHANLSASVSAEEALEQGFVTVRHTLESLGQLHALAPSIVARAGDEVVGYALTMLVEARVLVPRLEPMFQTLERLSWRGRSLREVPFYVMGQVCVAKAYRGRGVFDALYAGHRQEYASRFELLVTEISTRNARSLRAHERVGFVPIHHYRDDAEDWSIVALDWRDAGGPDPGVRREGAGSE